MYIENLEELITFQYFLSIPKGIYKDLFEIDFISLFKKNIFT